VSFNPCKTCPFLETSKNYGAPDWIEDVVRLIETKKTDCHTCHCTDSNADGYLGGKTRMCDGIKMLKINNDSAARIHEKAFRNWQSFFRAHISALKFEGIVR